MLGDTISDPDGTEEGGSIKGMGLLPADTVFRGSKTRTRVTGSFRNIEGDMDRLAGTGVEGYEIHMGATTLKEGAVPLTEITDEVSGETKEDGAHKDNIFGTYVHGIFDADGVAKKIVEALAVKKGMDVSEIESIDYSAFKEQQYDLLAQQLRENMDIKKIYEILEKGV